MLKLELVKETADETEIFQEFHAQKVSIDRSICRNDHNARITCDVFHYHYLF